MLIHSFRLSLIILVSLIAETCHSQDIVAQRKGIIDTLIKLVDAKYVYPDVAKKMTTYIRKRQQQKAYDTISSGESLARVITDDLRSISKDGHLSLDYSSKVIPVPVEQGAPSQKEIEDFRKQGESDNFAFKKLEILEGNIGYLRLNTFWPSDWIKEVAAGAMAFLKNADAVIIDLADNHGFADGGIVIQSYFFNEPTHMSDYINRDDGSTRQSWTMPVVPGAKLADKNLFIIVSKETFSAGEDFAYNMQAQKRAIVIGEATGGGAHGTRGYRLGDHFSVGIPHVYSVNPITKSDWEGKGVQPDIVSPKTDALRRAHIAAIQSVLNSSKDQNHVKYLTKIIGKLEAK